MFAKCCWLMAMFQQLQSQSIYFRLSWIADTLSFCIGLTERSSSLQLGEWSRCKFAFKSPGNLWIWKALNSSASWCNVHHYAHTALYILQCTYCTCQKVHQLNDPETFEMFKLKVKNEKFRFLTFWSDEKDAIKRRIKIWMAADDAYRFEGLCVRNVIAAELA